MKPGVSLLVIFGAIVSGCGGSTAPPAGAPAVSTLIRSPPLAKLTDQQLRSLSMRCEKYVPDKTSRGPYDAAYCEQAIAAWADAPLQMLPLRTDPVPQSTAPTQ